MTVTAPEPIIRPSISSASKGVTADAMRKDVINYCLKLDRVEGDKVTACMIHPVLKWFRVNWYNNSSIRRSQVLRVDGYAETGQITITVIQ